MFRGGRRWTERVQLDLKACRFAGGSHRSAVSEGARCGGLGMGVVCVYVRCDRVQGPATGQGAGLKQGQRRGVTIWIEL